MARDEQVAWLRRNAIPLSGVEAGRGFAELEPLKHVIGDARIVALGEATHGTREFFQLKHRLLEFLVSEMGFTTFALEANWHESLAVNDYVSHGRGDPAKALAGLRFWTWNTQEVLDLIVWMRKYNADGANERKVSFAGFDAQFTVRAAVAIKEYLARVDPAAADEIAPRLVLFEKECRDYSALRPEDVDALRSIAEELGVRLRVHERAYVRRSTPREWRLACQHVRVLQQVDEQRRAGDDDKLRYMIRDRAMAENIAWLLEDEDPQRKMVVWAHNAHVARDPRGTFDGDVVSMGMHLARRFGTKLVVVGFAFGEGAFQAVIQEEGDKRPIGEVVVGPPPDDSFDALLASTGLPVFMLDLRHLDKGVAEWLLKPHLTREIGAFFEEPQDMDHTIVPAVRYDLLAFVARTTRSRPIRQ